MNTNIIYLGEILPPEDFQKLSSVTPSANQLELDITKYFFSISANLSIISLNLNWLKISRKKIPKTIKIENELIIHNVIPGKLNLLGKIITIFRTLKEINIQLRIFRKKNNNETIVMIYNTFYLRSLPVLISKLFFSFNIYVLLADPIKLRNNSLRVTKRLTDSILLGIIKKSKGIITWSYWSCKSLKPRFRYIELYHSYMKNSDLIVSNYNYLFTSKYKYIMYSGLLDEYYGIFDIVSSVKYLPDDYRLIICGGGNQGFLFDQETIKNNAKIIYLSMIDRSEVTYLQTRVNLLLLIRKQDNQSNMFLANNAVPSKLTEYLYSGTPVLTTNVRAIPNAFRDFLNYTDGTSEDIAANVIKLTNGSIYSIRALKSAITAREFIEKECDFGVQMDKISDFITGKSNGGFNHE